MTNLVYGLDSMKFRKITYECAEQLKVLHNFNKKSNCAGPDWLKGCLKRNTNISVCKPESTSINRIEGFNKKEVELFYKNLEELMVKNKYEAHQIFNMDETGVSTVQEPGKILAKIGQKRVGTVTSWERRKTVTVVCAMNFAGVYVPPMFTYPRQHHSPLLEKYGPPGAIYDCSKNGWTNESLFFKWLQHFKTFVKHVRITKYYLF
ncbi:hypothetical protein ILUMI_16021 [Ignelater luminosus]|uniref:Uncharacterized protein n=1 Tax=Ignelater luminosus TaxID=2038154 RepID=A0A8K0CTP9_IGNLU|nr:hypothetical protein ILUMI_16021 [Ignelater luminosus]